MRAFPLTEIDDNRLTVLLLNGGGQQPYNKFHKISRFFLNYEVNVVALELPGHGSQALDRVYSDTEYVDLFLREFTKICAKFNRIAVFGFSLGALLSLKAIESGKFTSEFVIAAGVGLKISRKQQQIMQEYASIDFFDNMKWLPLMKKYHGNGWKFLLKSLRPMLVVGSNLFVNTSKFVSESPLFLVIGDSDGVADYSLQESFASQDGITLSVIENTAHFEYFSTGWEVMESALQEIVSNYLQRRDTNKTME